MVSPPTIAVTIIREMMVESSAGRALVVVRVGFLLLQECLARREELAFGITHRVGRLTRPAV